MEYEHFGILLKDLRKKYKMSREKLAENICTPKQIYRIEKGDSEPSVYLLHQLSIKFNLDLNEYYKMHFSNNTLLGLEGSKAINNAIDKEDLSLLQSLILKYEDMEDFKEGENLQLILYGKALCLALLEKDYITSLDYCFKGLRLECPDIDIDNIPPVMYSNIGFALLSCMSQNYFALKEYEAGMKVATKLLTILESFLINSPYPLFKPSPFSQRIYQTVLHNMGSHLFEHGELENALIYIEKGIAYSLKVFNLKYLPDLVLMKFKILYSLQKYSEAREFYIHAVVLFKITKQERVLDELTNTDYPEVFREESV